MVNSDRYLGAMWEPRLVLINPARLVREEKRLAVAQGVQVYEHSPVLALANTDGVHRLLDAGGLGQRAQARVRDERVLASVRAARAQAGPGVHVHDRDGAAHRRAA